MSIDYFGYLGVKESYVIEGGNITVVADFDKAREWIEEYINKDCYLYPPMTRTIKLDPLTLEEKEVVPKTERPALLHKLPYTHSIEIYDDGTVEEHRKGPSAFLINLLGFLLGYRLQFHDWWFDGRVQIKRNNGLFVTNDTVEDFLSYSFDAWKTWDADNQNLITNLLYMFCRSPQYEWEWERFTVDYMVIDGLWKLHKDLRKIESAVPHKQRITHMCKYYEIPEQEECISEIVRLRNDLFHESLWDSGQPCNGGSNDAFYQAMFLRNIIKRLVPAVIGYETLFVKTEWWHLGTFSFDKR